MLSQILIDKTALTPAKILVILLGFGMLLGAFGIYDYIIDFASSGATVPISGFGNVVSQGVIKAVSEKGFLGIFTGGLTASSGGIAAAIGFAFLMAVIFKAKRK